MRLAFYRSRSSLDHEFISQRKTLQKHAVLHAIDAIVNLATVNYLLHGFQAMLYNDPLVVDPQYLEWNRFYTALITPVVEGRFNLPALQSNAANPAINNEEIKKRMTHIVQYLITPLGVCKGSQQQGGQHQVGYNCTLTQLMLQL